MYVFTKTIKYNIIMLEMSDNMDGLLNKTEREMLDAIANMEGRFDNVRAGRANPAILDGVMVDYYEIGRASCRERV